MSEDELRHEMTRETTSVGPQCPSLLPKEENITRSDKVWLADGNVILQTSTKCYRVHRSVLSFHSSIFEDMFRLPQPVEQPEVFEGCPVIRLTDSTEDWDELLPLFYNMRDLRDDERLINLHLMVAMLRLGNKYGCDRLKTQALEQLHRVFPSNFYGCKSRLEGDAWDGSSYEEFVMEDEFYLLDVALELGIQTVLPFAFFMCLCNCTTAQILAGSYDSGPARSGILRSQTRDTLLQANGKIMKDIVAKVYPWWKRAKCSSGCTTKELCTDAIRKNATQMIGIPSLRELFLPKVEIRLMKGLCQACKDHGASSINNGQSQVFEVLPKYFGLPEWAELKDFEN